MDDLINRANLPSVLNGVTMSECDKVIEPFLEERSCDEVWHTVRALRDFYDWVMSENAVEPKQGEWIEVESYECEDHIINDMRCNLCGKYSQMALPFKMKCVYSYCPWCGARMFAKDTNVPNKEGVDNE